MRCRLSRKSSASFSLAYIAHKKEAAEFLKFIHTPEITQAFYDHTGVMPADKKWTSNPDNVKTDYDKQTMEWLGLPYTPTWFECYVPAMLDFDGVGTAFTKMVK